MKRERNFKVYLNNPSMRAALFTPVNADDPIMVGHLAECAVFSQWQHARTFKRVRYARWRNEGEVDVVYLDGSEKPTWVGEVKWSDRVRGDHARETKNMAALIKKHKTIKSAFFTTKTYQAVLPIDEVRVRFVPTALYCYGVGRNITDSLDLYLATKKA